MPEDNTHFQSNTDYYPTAQIPSQGAGRQGSSGGDVKEKVQRLASETEHKVGGQLRSQITAAKERAASNVGTIAQSLVQTGQQARQQDPNVPVQPIERVGQQLQKTADYLRNTDVDQVVDQTEDFARRQPAVFLGAAFALGLIGARFIKSSRRSEQREQEQQGRSTGFSDSARRGTISDSERPVAGYREPTGAAGDVGLSGSRGTVEGRAATPEWTGTPGGFSDNR